MDIKMNTEVLKSSNRKKNTVYSIETDILTTLQIYIKYS